MNANSTYISSADSVITPYTNIIVTTTTTTATNTIPTTTATNCS